MRANPTISDPSNILTVYNMNSNSVAGGFSFSVVGGQGDNTIIIEANKPNHGLTDAYLTFGSNDKSKYVIFDANL